MRHIVNALFLRAGPEILLARRAAHRKAYGGLWSFPGGHMEAGETPDQALVREIREELGVVALAYEALARIADPNAQTDPATYHLYAVTRWSGGEPEIRDREHSELRWFRPDDALLLPDLALEEYRPLLRELGRR
ncbi:MAG: NUDIX domain-containing protein [Proteobacteria bacterium]|nr:NUDIX domain-containing protein [Pseudomonadota bacterium]